MYNGVQPSSVAWTHSTWPSRHAMNSAARPVPVVAPTLAGAASPFLIGSYNDYGATELAMSPPAWSTTGFTILQYPNLVCPDGNRDVLSAEECEGLASANGLTLIPPSAGTSSETMNIMLVCVL